MDINNLMENVRAFFAEQYKGVDKSNLFISFEPLGTMLDPSEFKDNESGISDIKATEQLSILGDRLPQISDIFLPTTNRMSTVYEMLLEGSVFTGTGITADDKTPYIARFGELKSESLSDLNDARKASIEMPEGTYLPVYGYPKKWYDPQSSFWVNKTFSEQEKKPAEQTKPLSPAAKSLISAWRTKLVIDPETLTKAAQKTKIDTRLIEPIKKNLLLQAQAMPVNKTAAKVTPVTTVKPVATATMINKVTLNTTAKVQPAPIQPLVEMKNLNLLKTIKFADRVRFTNELVKDNSTPPAPVQSNGFSMSFDYCIVNLERRWFNTSLFSYANLWYCLSMQENYFSTGAKDESNTGLLKCVPTAMILIKNLRIKAAWTDEDKANAKSSIGLGVFNLNDSTFSNNELVTPGMQIIGWMCEVMPKLPALGDPNIK